MRKNALNILLEGTAIPATPLALDANRKFNEKRQRLLMRYYLNAGAGGIATGVHSTQFEIHDEKVGLLKPVLEVVADEINLYEKKSGKTVIKIAGVCGPAKQAANEAELAGTLGYDAVLLSPGGLPDYTENDFIERTKTVAKTLPVIGFALQPAAGGRVFSYNYWEQLCAIDNVLAIKAAPFNRYQTLDIARAAAMSGRAGEISLYTGNDDNIAVDLLTIYQFPKDGKVYSIKFAGGLLGHYTYWTKNAVEQLEMFKKARDSGTVGVELLSMAAKITDMNAAVFDAKNNFSGCISGIHEVLRRQGLMEGIWCINENERLSDGQAEEITRVCNMYPELTDDDFVKENIEDWVV